jgi:hypothetical protein
LADGDDVNQAGLGQLHDSLLGTGANVHDRQWVLWQRLTDSVDEHATVTVHLSSVRNVTSVRVHALRHAHGNIQLPVKVVTAFSVGGKTYRRPLTYNVAADMKSSRAIIGE